MESVSEEWRPVPGHPNYEVSNLGNVRSKDTVKSGIHPRWKTPCERKRKGMPLKPIGHRGYLVVKLGRPNLVRGIHQLVAWAWHGEQGDKVVNHINADKHDNRPENLEYVTNSENVHHAYGMGLMRVKGIHNGNAILSDEDVREIRRMKGTKTSEELAEQFGVGVGHMKNVLGGRCRKTV